MKGRVIATLLGLAVAAPLAAHDLYMKLDSFFVPANTRIQVSLINGTFDASEGSVKRERARRIDIMRAGHRQSTKNLSWSSKGDTSHLRFRTGASGTYVLGVSLIPRSITLSGKNFNSYLEEDGIPWILERRRERNELDASAREQYAKHVKAIIQVGDTRTGGWDTRLGYPAELVPLSNPYTLAVGDTLKLVALVDRKPAPGMLVLAGYQRDGSEPVKAGSVTADSTGVVSIAIASAGKWYVKFISMEPVKKPKLDYESKWATLTFELR